MKKNLCITLTSLMGLAMIGQVGAYNDSKLVPSFMESSYVDASQSRIVYYRTNDVAGKSAAHVYVDGEFETALLPGRYHSFCTTAGSHSVSSFTDDAPTYEGKRAQYWRGDLESGETYFIRADLAKDGRPVVVDPEEALEEIRGLNPQSHVISRASAVEECKEPSSMQPTQIDSPDDIFFEFNRSGPNDIVYSDRQKIEILSQMLIKQENQSKHITITGYTDPLGSEKLNLLLGKRRAETVKSMLISNGVSKNRISVNSVGKSQVATQCEGNKQSQIKCFANERRVSVRVEIE